MYCANILTSTKSQWFILSLLNMPSGVLDMAQKKKIKQKKFFFTYDPNFNGCA